MATSQKQDHTTPIRMVAYRRTRRNLNFKPDEDLANDKLDRRPKTCGAKESEVPIAHCTGGMILCGDECAGR